MAMKLAGAFRKGLKWDVGLDLDHRWARLVALSRTDDGKVVLEAAEVSDASAGSSMSASLSAIWRGMGRSAGMVHCNLGPVAAIVQVFEFPEMDREEMAAAARIEAGQLIPNIEEMALDLQVLGPRKGRADEPAKFMVLVVAAPKDVLNDRARLLFDAGLPVLSIVPDGIALANAVQALRSPAAGAQIVVDIGTQDSLVVAVSRQQSIPTPFCHYISYGMDLLMEGKAVGAGATYVEGGGRAFGRERWLREIERSIEFAETRAGGPPAEIMVVGEGVESRELLDWMGENMLVPIKTWNPLLELDRGPGAPDEQALKARGHHCALALGLALLRGDEA
jgi:Tfp pilus assembly PilM family ATPase